MTKEQMAEFHDWFVEKYRIEPYDASPDLYKQAFNIFLKGAAQND